MATAAAIAATAAASDTALTATAAAIAAAAAASDTALTAAQRFNSERKSNPTMTMRWLDGRAPRLQNDAWCER